MSLCLAKLAEQEMHEKEAFKRVLIRICDDKEKANNIMSEMLRRGLIERHVVVTDKGREALQRIRVR